jgi:voltage-gated potassium channel
VVIQRSAATHPSEALGSTDPTHSGAGGPGDSGDGRGPGDPSGPGTVGFWRGERGGGS